LGRPPRIDLTSRREQLDRIGLMATCAVLIGSMLWMLAVIWHPWRVAPSPTCDRALAALLAATDMVAVTRAGIIIARLECNMAVLARQQDP
jgi:NhaP-type Na+/H+ or K+/H+ antiporter